MPRTLKRGKNAGITLVEVLISGALAAVIVLLVGRVFQQASTNTARLTERSDLEEVRQVLRREISCRETFKAGAPGCAPGFIQVFGHRRHDTPPSTPTPAVIRAPSPASDRSTYTTFGPKLIVRASCVPCTTGVCPGSRRLLVEVNRVSLDGSLVLADTGTGRTLNNLTGNQSSVGLASGWIDLFDGVPIGCAIP